MATPTVTMLPTAGVSEPKRWRKSTARASLSASLALFTSSRPLTCAVVRPSRVTFLDSQSRAAAGAFAGSLL